MATFEVLFVTGCLSKTGRRVAILGRPAFREGSCSNTGLRGFMFFIIGLFRVGCKCKIALFCEGLCPELVID